MKKILKSVIAATVIIMGSSLMADFIPDGEQSITTVAQALKASDGTFVSLTGRITGRIGKKKYSFSDSSGEVTLIISKRAWRRLDVSAQSTVTITGTVHSGFWDMIGISSKPEVEVDTVSVVNGQIDVDSPGRHEPLRNAIGSLEDDI
ncbi:MAG TPA: hypothetical protein DD381_09815 [Lentisphaeria bacterium]|nr:MAG: hypothetical protein A2X47_09765 [Lentisphaerae bacterium GWF2_38_69]HBM16621.1 hypothetical protein [Lentisphaeria bacterium]